MLHFQLKNLSILLNICLYYNIAWCLCSYVHTGLPGNETNQEFDNYNMYNEYETSKDEAVAPAKALTCGDDGYWNSGNDEDLGFCKGILII